MTIRVNTVALKMAVVEKGYTYKDLATKTGLSTVTITKLMNGNSSPHAKSAKRLSDVLDKPVTELFTVE